MPLIRSWVQSANAPDHPFPLNNLPYGVFEDPADPDRTGCCVAIGDRVLDVTGLAEAGGLDDPDGLFFFPDLIAFLGAGPEVWSRIRADLSALLAEGAAPDTVAPHLIAMSDIRMLMPFTVAEYTDFYSGRHHAVNVGSMFRGPENALPPNWEHMPIGYNGRASSVVVSGTPVRRPWGQIRPHGETEPRLSPARRFDFELEMGAVVGGGGTGPLSVAEADAMIFGYVLLNDWSARDIQAWEYQPLGPFQAKATATTISPWVVPAAALAPFRHAGAARNGPLLPYLSEPGPMLYDVQLEVHLRPGDQPATVLSRTNYAEMYYSAAQQLAHHALSGCPMRPGDLLGSGTISGPSVRERGSLLELCWGGKEPLALDTGQTRTFLEDGDTVTLAGWAAGDGYRIGFGDCAGTLLPALDQPPWKRE